MTPKKPVLVTPTKPEKSPLPGNEKVQPKCWTFGFSSFKQIPYFGFDNISPKWFASLFERLKSLSQEPVDGFLADGPRKTRLRFHDIDWNATKIPISRQTLDWLPEDVKNNPVEFPLQQFQISKAMGRIVGYFDDNQVFQIVLLDPLHNLQPSGAHNYRVTRNLPLNCEYTQLRENILKAAMQSKCADGACPVRDALAAIDSKPPAEMNVLLMKPSDDAVKNANELVAAEKATSYEDIFETGILHFMEGLPNSST